MLVVVLCTAHTWMEYPSTTHGMRLYHACNTPESCIGYASACTTHGIRLEYASFMHEIFISFMHGTCMKFRHQSMHVTYMSHSWKMSQIPACYMHVSGIMHITHEISNYSILLLDISCRKLSGFGCMKCTETCMHVSGTPFWVGSTAKNQLVCSKYCILLLNSQ